MQGDCLEKMKEIESGSVDMVLADPPYGTTMCKWDAVIPLEPMWAELRRIIKHNAAIVMTACQPFTTDLIYSNRKMFRYTWVYHKSNDTGFLNCWRMPMRAHEDVLVFYSKLPTYNPQIKDRPKKNIRRWPAARKGNETVENVVYDKSSTIYGKYSSTKSRTLPKGKSMPNSIIKFNREVGLHPTQKPVPLMEYLIKTYTNKGETVLDFTMGSGTTGVASKHLNRDFIGIELDNKYFAIAEERINKAVRNEHEKHKNVLETIASKMFNNKK